MPWTKYHGLAHFSIPAFANTVGKIFLQICQEIRCVCSGSPSLVSVSQCPGRARVKKVRVRRDCFTAVVVVGILLITAVTTVSQFQHYFLDKRNRSKLFNDVESAA